MVPPCSDRISRVPPYSRIQQPGRIRGYHPLWPDFPDRSAYNCRTTGLFRVRSPLLAESLLMSVPPGTEMFQFPGFASYAYVFSIRYPCGWVAPFGYPRINACSRLPVAFRSVPRPSSPPGAKASTECPSYTRYPGLFSEESSLTMHRNHPRHSPLGDVVWMILEISTPHIHRIFPSRSGLRLLAQSPTFLIRQNRSQRL